MTKAKPLHIPPEDEPAIRNRWLTLQQIIDILIRVRDEGEKAKL